MTARLVVRADASGEIGTGHVMRCLALAQAWRDQLQGDVVFLSAELTDRIEARIRSEGFGSEPWPSAGDVLSGASWVAVDGAHIGAETRDALRRRARRLLVIDDHGTWPSYRADILLNQNLFARAETYQDRAPADCRRLIGPSYALLRQDIARAIVPARAHSGSLEHLLVLLGGADVAGQTARLIKILAGPGVPGSRVTVVLGPGFPDPQALAGSVAADPKRIVLRHDPADLPALFATADLAISCAGVTLLELAAMGTPVLTVSSTPAERSAAAAAETLGLARNLGDVASLDGAALGAALGQLQASPEVLRAMCRAGQAAVDGQGASRVVEAMRALA